MRKVLSAAVLSVGVLLLGLASTASAVEPSKTNVPFPFIVNGTVLPAGEYRVVPVGGLGDIVQVISETGKAEAMTAVEPADSSSIHEDGSAVFSFRKVGDHYFLARIDVKGEGSLLIPLSERTIARDLEKLAARPQINR